MTRLGCFLFAAIVIVVGIIVARDPWPEDSEDDQEWPAWESGVR